MGLRPRLVDQSADQRVVGARDLERQRPSGSDVAEEPFHERPVVGHPLQCGVGEDHVDGGLGTPLPDAGHHPLAIGVFRARGLDHVGRVVEPEDAR